MAPAQSVLDPVLELVLAWQPAATRPALEALFRLDTRLRGIVRGAREPMLGQIKLAWWRERLAELSSTVPAEPLLTDLHKNWGPRAEALQPLVDGWEATIAEDTGDGSLGRGRAAALQAFALLAEAKDDEAAAGEVGYLWAHAEAGGPLHNMAGPDIVSKKLRGVAVLGGLAARAIALGSPLHVDRGAALAAWRLGLFGR